MREYAFHKKKNKARSLSFSYSGLAPTESQLVPVE